MSGKNNYIQVRPRRAHALDSLLFIPFEVSTRPILPQKAMCSECGFILYEGDLLKTPNDIMRKFEDRCPECRRRLIFSMDRISITPYEEEENESRP